MSCVRSYESHSDEETRAIGRELAALLPERGVVLLIGDLGAGKTTLTKGLAEARGAAAADEVSSPTFTLIHEYGTPVRVYHVDLYRLDTEQEVRGLGIEDLFEARALVLIEWGERFPFLVAERKAEIRINHKGGDDRHIELSYSEIS